MEKFHRIPLNFNALLKKQRLPMISVKESVREHINLVLMTEVGAWRYDVNYKCALWEKDFEQTDNMASWLDEVRDDMAVVIKRYETRLRNLNVDIKRDELPEINREGKVTRIRNRLKIGVRGVVIQTEEAFDEEFTMFFGPITIL